MAVENKVGSLSAYDFDRLLKADLALIGNLETSGTATGGSQTTLQDTAKDWRANVWATALVLITIGSIEYTRLVASNIVDTLTFDALPALIAVSSGDKYTIRRALGAVNPRSEAGVGQIPVGITVTALSTQILAANANRKVAIICNDSDTTIYLAVGVAAQANKGIRLNANGGVIVISQTGDIFSTEAVYGILAAVGSKVATAQELN